MQFQGCYGSSSLKDCIDLLNATANSSPSPLHSGLAQNSTDPLQFLSPSIENTLTDANTQSSNGSIRRFCADGKPDLAFLADWKSKENHSPKQGFFF